MSSATTMFEVGAVVLGYVGMTASWRRTAAGNSSAASRYPPLLVIQCSDSTDEHVHAPAASITLNDRAAMLALRAAIDEALKEPGGAG